MIEYSDLTLTWNGSATDNNHHHRHHHRKWYTHTLFLSQASEYFACAVRGGFREAQEACMDLTHLVPHDQVLDLALQWMYCDSFLEQPASLDVAVALVEFGSAILCTRLCHYTSQTALIPALTSENVFDMLLLSRLHNLERLEEKCVEVIALSLPWLADSEELQQVLREEIRQTSQKGDVHVMDVPIAAEIRSNLHKVDETELEVDRPLLMDMFEAALERAIAAEHQGEESFCSRENRAETKE
jgi:hypothetical protein